MTTTSTSFQVVFDNAETISINKKKKVSQTVSRDGTVKALSLGGQTWQFEVKLPDGPRWTTYRPLIEKIENLDRVTVGQVQINKADHSWINGYQGNLTNLTGVTVTASTGTTLTITGGATLPSGFRFKSGDFVQLTNNGTNYSVYTVVDNVAFNSNTIELNRPIRETTAVTGTSTYTLKIGQNVVWNVVCVDLPQWTIVGRDQISWSGPFVFSEAL